MTKIADLQNIKLGGHSKQEFQQGSQDLTKGIVTAMMSASQ
jgi:hypothetical protein